MSDAEIAIASDEEVESILVCLRIWLITVKTNIFTGWYSDGGLRIVPPLGPASSGSRGWTSVSSPICDTPDIET